MKNKLTNNQRKETYILNQIMKVIKQKKMKITNNIQDTTRIKNIAQSLNCV